MIDEKDYWRNKSWDEPTVPTVLKVSNTEIERRYKISTTSRAKMATDAEFQQIKCAAARKGADVKRVIPLEDHESIIREYWDPSIKRKHGFIDVIAERYSHGGGYGSKLTGVISKIIMNSYNTLQDAEYSELRAAWEKANPYFRTEMQKDLYKSGKRKSNGLQNSITSDSVDAPTAQKIYTACLKNKDSRTQKNYQRLAKLYNVKQWQKVRDIANGHHYSLRDSNVDYDIEQWRLNISEGNYEMIDSYGVSYTFNDLKQLGYFLNQHWGKDTTDETRNWYTGRAWFEKCTANTWYTKERRTFKGWKYCNHLPAKTK